MDQYYQNKELVFKTRWITENGFYFAEVELPEISLTQYLNNPEEVKEHIIFIPFSQIKRVIPLFDHEPPLLDIDVFDQKSYQAVVADFGNKAQLKEVVQEIEKRSGLQEVVEHMQDKTWMRNLLYTIVIAYFGYALVMTAKALAEDEALGDHSNRSGFNGVLAAIAGQLGILGSVVLSVVLVSGFAYFTYTIYSSSNTKRVVWKK